MGKLTVITRQRMFNEPIGSVIEVDDTPMVRGLIARNRLDLVDPPELPKLEGDSDGNKSSDQAGASEELPSKPKRSRAKRATKASAECPPEGEGTSSEGSNGRLGEESADSFDHTEGEAYSPGDS